MTEKVNPSPFRPAEAFKTAGAIHYAGDNDNFIVPAANPTVIASQDSGIDETTFTAFDAYGSSKAFDASTQDTSVQDIAFNGDGSLMYVVGASTDTIYAYALSTAYDVSTATLDHSLDVSVALATPVPTGMEFNGDGTKLFVSDSANADIAEYALSTAYDVSTATLNDTTDVSVQDGEPEDVSFNSNGTLMYVVGDTNDSIYEYALSTAYDASTATLNDSLSVGTQDNTPRGMQLGDNDTRLYVVGSQNDNIYEYTLSTAGDISTATLDASFSVGGQETVPNGVTWFDNGRSFVIAGQGSNYVHSYPLGLSWEIETAVFGTAVNPGEAFIFGSWLATDLGISVSLAESTANQTVYVGWDKDASDNVIIGTDSAFSNTASNSDQRIPLYDISTDAHQVTSVTELREIGNFHTSEGFIGDDTHDAGSRLEIDSDEYMVVGGSYTLNGDADIQGDLVTVSNKISHDNLADVDPTDHLEVVKEYQISARTGDTPAFDAELTNAYDSQLKAFDVTVAPTAGLSDTYAFNFDVGRKWSNGSWDVPLTVNWDQDPGSDLDLTVRIHKRT